MKNLILFLFITLYHSTLFSQEKALAKVHYFFSHINDTTKRDQPQKDEVVLLLGEKSTYYRSFAEDRVKESIDKQKLAVDYDGSLVLSFSTSPIQNSYLIFSEQQRLINLESVSSGFDVYYTEEELDLPIWSLQDDVKEVGGYKCQLATTQYKGREYFAWFTVELPFQAGPWKLQGTPGLILSAYDKNKEVIFEYAGFELLSTDDAIRIEIPFYALKGSKADIKRQRDAFQNDQENYFAMLNNSGRLSVANNFYGIDYAKNKIYFDFDDSYKPSFITNNPIELKK